MDRRRRLGWVVETGLYLLVFFLAGWAFYRRFPTNFTQPNFFAEDGKEFAAAIMERGLWSALGTRFNGYFIWGLFLLTDIGRLLNFLLYGGELVTLPQSLALTSYGFLGFCASMPLWLFRSWFPLRYRLPWVALACTVPMGVSDYAVIGTIGNLKYAFVFVAFLLAVYRHRLPARSPAVWGVDTGILIAGYTNGTVYLLTPFLLLRYWPIVRAHGARAWRVLLTDRTFQSLIALALLLVPQIAIIAIQGLPKLPGYMDEPFVWRNGVELFVHRSYAYSLLYWVQRMNDGKALVFFALLVGGGLFVARREDRPLLLFAVFAILAATGLFAATRPGIAATFSRYGHGSFDQFFYAQNWIFYFFFVVALYGAFERPGVAPALRWAPTLILLFFLLPLRKTGSWGTNGEMREHVGSIYEVAPRVCAGAGDRLSLPIYPRREWLMSVPREALCTRRALARGAP